MKTETYDTINKRTIKVDYDNDSITIIGDFSCSSITTYWVVNKSNMAIPTGIYIKKENAEIRRKYLNYKHNTNTFIIITRTIFV